ncbi:MAG TPA: hypothetical protein VEI51_05705 [Methanomicrobiales archaeon]|nr:hypothetical protein [Methanomicrobiales archaeon]
MQHGRLGNRDDGVSVIVGTLLLILVAVTAVAGLALMVSQMQKETLDRQSHLADVQNEDLKIQSIALTDSADEWNVTNTSGSDSAGNWSSLSFTLINLNTKDSFVTGIGVKPMNSGSVKFAYNYSADTPPGSMYNLSHYLVVPATKSVRVSVSLVTNFSPRTPDASFDATNNSLYLHDDDGVVIDVVTSLQNVFEETFRPPVPVIKYQIETDDLTVAQRAVLVLDGSGSTADGNVVQWNWTLLDGSDPNLPQPINWTALGTSSIAVPPGKVVRQVLDDNGPFQARLTVTDDRGMIATSAPVGIPVNQAFDPAVSLQVSKFTDSSGDTGINATVRDIRNNPMDGAVVSFIITNTDGTLVLSPLWNMTYSYGNASTIFRGNGTVQVKSGKLPPVDVAVP